MQEKNRTTVEYALNQLNQPIGVASYRVTLTLPKDYKNLLPSPEMIIEKYIELALLPDSFICNNSQFNIFCASIYIEFSF
jgi:hypothetical protein